jgi:hypothetical protein
MTSAIYDRQWTVSTRPRGSVVLVCDERGAVVARVPKRADADSIAKAIAAVPELLDIATRLASGYDPALVRATAVLLLQAVRS